MFKKIFWSFKLYVDGFEHCKPILLVDETFLFEKFQHTSLIASSVDSNNRLFHVFLQLLKEIISQIGVSLCAASIRM